MSRWALLLVLLAVNAQAAPATSGAPAIVYVTDELVLGVYAEENSQGQRLTTLHSGGVVESLGVHGEFTQVRLNDGTIGWVKSSFLTDKEPATVRVKQLEEELARSRATTPALAEAAARSEVDQLRRELAAQRAESDQSKSALAASGGTAASGTHGREWPWRLFATFGLAILAAIAAGFWLGHATLARRVRRKFGGIRVY